MTFWVTGNPYCGVLKVPHGTILKRDITDDRILIRDMQFHGCQSGRLYANVYLWRGIRNPQNGRYSHVYVTNKRDMFLGMLGCPEGCLRCNGSNSCTLCANSQNRYLSNGTCYDNRCPESSPYYLTYREFYNNSEYSGNLCYEGCPSGYFNPKPGVQGDPKRSTLCLECFKGC